MQKSRINFALNAGGKRRTAFTLAEVLITLTIIGVIAAIVIPTLMQRHLEQEMIVKLKKNYSVFSNALVQAIRENGPIDEWDIGTNSSSSYQASNALYKYLKPYLKVQKECGKSSSCFAPVVYKALFADRATAGIVSIDSHANFYKLMLEDGTSIAFSSRRTTNCRSNPNYCGVIYLDLNGAKGPNRYGVDLQRLHIGKTIWPAGLEAPTAAYDSEITPLRLSCEKEGESGNCCAFNHQSPANGAYCALHVLYKGNMDYLHRSIVDDWPVSAPAE